MRRAGREDRRATFHAVSRSYLLKPHFVSCALVLDLTFIFLNNLGENLLSLPLDRKKNEKIAVFCGFLACPSAL